MGPIREYKGKYNMEVPNSVEPFFNAEEGLKISNFTVYNMPQNRSHASQKYYAKLGPKREIKKEVLATILKQQEDLNQT